MQTEFKVQNPHSIPVTKTVDVEGEKMQVTIAGFEVQLLSVDGMSGTLVQRFYGADAKAAKELFVNDTIVVADWSAKKV